MSSDTISNEINRPNTDSPSNKKPSKMSISKGLPFTGKVQVVIASMDGGYFESFDPYSGKKIHSMKGHKDSVWAIKTIKNGQYIYSVSSDRTFRIWDSRTGECTYTFPSLTTKIEFKWITALAVNKEYAVCGTDSGHFIIYKRLTEDMYDQIRPAIQIHQNYGGIYAIELSPGSQILIGTENGRLLQYDIASGKCVFDELDHSKEGQITFIKRAGSKLYTTSQYDEKIHVRDLRQLKDTKSEMASHVAPVWHVVEHDGFIYSCSADGSIKKWHPSKPKEPIYTLSKFHDGECIYKLGVVDDELMASCGGNGKIHLFKMATGEIVRTVQSVYGVHDMAIIHV
mmetsp:Transcript_10805/g.15825  ORF Transcript_10805/g.15825 Transcript_10805/m.15825 type:complete len:341 (-) Transcript_10805:43-1065(-)